MGMNCFDPEDRKNDWRRFNHRAVSEIKMIEIDLLFADRKVRYPECQPALTDSIKREGIRHPLDVCESDGKYLVMAGVRRLQACKDAGLLEVPCRVWSLF